jgi:transcriptional regulator with XRE-family HTH domain
MSEPSSRIAAADIERLTAEMGGCPGDIERDADTDAVIRKLQELRAGILEAMQADGVSVRELARRRGVSAAAVSRALAGAGDMHIGTAVLLARALGRALPDLGALGAINRAPQGAVDDRLADAAPPPP